MISRHPIDTDNERRYASWIARDGRVKAAGIAPDNASTRVLRAMRARYLEEIARITDELQARGVE